MIDRKQVQRSHIKNRKLVIEKNTKHRLFEVIEIVLDNKEYSYNNKLDIIVNENAKLEIVKIQLLNEFSNFNDDINIRLEKNAILEVIDVQIGGKTIKSKYVTDLIRTRF